MKTKGKILTLLIVCGAMFFLTAFVAADETVVDDSLIRFHVIANSDTIYDQSIKLKVRDAVIEKINQVLESAENKNEAEQLLHQHSNELLKTANNVLTKENCGYIATAKLGTSIFPTKTYGDITLPAGKYNAYKIILGEGRGKNWWCVLYPPLCFVDINDDTAVAVTQNTEYSENADKQDIFAVNGNLYQIKLKSKLLEFLP